MSLFTKAKYEARTEEYVKERAPDEVFPVKRIVQIKPVYHNGTYYFRTRDVAELLGMKQPFQFAADLREAAGSSVILSGKDTEAFRKKDDDFRVTFISAQNLYQAMTQMKLKNQQKTNETLKEQVIKALQAYL